MTEFHSISARCPFADPAIVLLAVIWDCTRLIPNQTPRSARKSSWAKLFATSCPGAPLPLPWSFRLRGISCVLKLFSRGICPQLRGIFCILGLFSRGVCLQLRGTFCILGLFSRGVGLQQPISSGGMVSAIAYLAPSVRWHWRKWSVLLGQIVSKIDVTGEGGGVHLKHGKETKVTTSVDSACCCGVVVLKHQQSIFPRPQNF